jgi:hypothetical protein
MRADSKRPAVFAMRIPIAIFVAHLSTAALSASLPSFDIKAACSILSRDQESESSSLYRDCLENEVTAREHLSQSMPNLSDEKVKSCADSIVKEGSASYLALLGCVETPAPQPDASVTDTGASSGKDTGLKPPSKSAPIPSAADKPLSAQPDTNQGYQFTRDLGVGAVDPDVKELQAFLNSHGAQIASDGPGSPGKEVDVFGPSTQAALIKFQETHKAEVLTPAGITKATGFFGSTTRNYVNKLVTGH